MINCTVSRSTNYSNSTTLIKVKDLIKSANLLLAYTEKLAKIITTRCVITLKNAAFIYFMEEA
jgi:hypothetical protein